MVDVPTTVATLDSVLDDALATAGVALQVDDAALSLVIELPAWRGSLADAWVLLDEAERGRVLAKRRDDHRLELALAYALHRLVLARVLRVAPARVDLGRDALGRPCLGEDALHTSLSHAAGAVAIAVSRTGPLGIDLEPADRWPVMEEIAARVCDRAEARRLAGMRGEARGRALLALWVRKEALLKAAGVGMAVEMDGFAAPEHATLPLPGAKDGQCVVVTMLDAGANWVAAAATPPGLPVEAWRLRLR